MDSMVLKKVTTVVLMVVGVCGQIPPQPVVTTSSACLNGCFQDGSLVFAASNLKNFEKIIVNVEQFCTAHEKLMKCAASCTEADRDQLNSRVSLSQFICNEKIEELRVVNECMQSQGIETVNQCADKCGLPSDSTIQLDSSPSAAVNPFAFFDSITPVCRNLECVVKCSISESNKKCAGSGDIFKEIASKQVEDASARLHADLDNSSSPVASQLAKIYLEALPEQCSFLVDTDKYNTVFAENEEDEGSEMVTATASMDDFGTASSLAYTTPVTTLSEAVNEDLDSESTPTTINGQLAFMESTTVFPLSSLPHSTPFSVEPLNPADIPIAAILPQEPINEENIGNMDVIPSPFDDDDDTTKTTVAVGVIDKTVVVETTSVKSLKASDEEKVVASSGRNEPERTIMVVNQDTDADLVKGQDNRTDKDKKNGAQSWTPLLALWLIGAVVYVM